MSGKYIETKGGWNRTFAVAIFVFIFLVGFLVVGVGGVGAFPDTIDKEANVSEPSTINKSGTYDVNQSFDSGVGITAVYINASNVSLNLNGHSITNNSTSFGIIVRNQSNVTIEGQGGEVKDFKGSETAGVSFINTTGGTVNNTTISNNTAGVVTPEGSNETTVTNSTIDSNKVGISVMQGSWDVGIYDNYINNSTDAGVQIESDSNVTNFDTLEEDNIFANNDENISVDSGETDDGTINVTFNVTDKDGVGIEGATVLLDDDKANQTNTTGIAEFNVSEKREYPYTISKSGYATATGKIDVSGDNVTKNITLQDGHSITFTVNNTSDKLLEKASISLFNEESRLENRTNASGGAVFWVANDTYDYQIQKPGYVWANGKITVSGENISQNETLEPGYGITFEVEDESGDPLKDARIKLKDQDQSDAGKNSTDENGTATIWQTNGTYKYEVAREGNVSQAEQFKINGSDLTLSPITLPAVQYTVTFNITNESGQPIPAQTYIMLYGDEYTKVHGDVNESGISQYGLNATGTYTYVADADDKIRKGGQFETDGTDTEVNITLRDPDRTQLEGYAEYPNGTPMAGANVTVKGLNESMAQDQQDPVVLNSTESNATGYFNLTRINETTSVPNLNKYIIDIRKYNDSNDALEYRSESYLQWIDEHSFARLTPQTYTLTEAVTYNVKSEGIPEYLQEGAYKDNASVTNYSHSLEWMDNTEQWAYVSNQSNLTILESNFSVNRTLDLPVDNASGLHYNGSHIYTLNTSGTEGTEGETRAYALNVSASDEISIEENFTLAQEYEKVFALEYANESFYVWGQRNNSEPRIDKYNDTFADNESVADMGYQSDIDPHFHDGRWYFVGEPYISVYNETFEPVDRVRGDRLHGLNLDQYTTGIAHNGSDWFIASNETSNISRVHLTDKGVKGMDYKVMDAASGDILVESHRNGDFEVSEFNISHVANRDVLFTLDKNGSALNINKEVSDVTDPKGWENAEYNEATRELNLTINLTQKFRRVSGHVEHNGSDNFTNLSVVYRGIDANNLASHYGEHNRTAVFDEPDEYDPENGTYDVGIITPINESARYLVQFTAYNETEDEHYGAIKEITLDPGGDDVSDFNASLQPLQGNETDLVPFGPGGTVNITTKMKRFQFVNSTGHLVEPEEYGARVYMDYSEDFDSSTEVIWRRQPPHTPNSNKTGFDVMTFGADGMYVNVYAADYIPTSYSLSEEELKADGPVNITLKEFEEGEMILDEGKTPDIETYLYSGETADQPHPVAADTVSESYVGQEPLKVRLQNHQTLLNILGGNVSFRMTDINNDITVHYSNVDASRSGAPDAFFSSQAETTGAGDDLESLWKFGSSGPSIYDKVLVSTPYDDSTDENHTVHITHLYDDDMNVIWNASEGDDVDDIPSHYSTYVEDDDYRAYVNGTGVDCQVDDPDLSEGLCYKDEGNTSLWMEIPHFSAVGLNVGTANESDVDGGDEEEETTDDTSSYSGPSGDDDEPEPAPEPVVEEAIVDDVTGEATASVDASAGQQVEIQIPSSAADTARESMIEGISATSGTDQQISVSVRSVEREDVTVPSRESQVSFDEIDVEGEVEGASVTFSVRKDTLDDRGADPADVVKERFDPEDEEWQSLETSLDEELDERYRFEAAVPEFSLFATAIEAEEEPITEEPTTEEPATIEEPTEEPPGTEQPAIEDEPVTEEPGEETGWGPIAGLVVLLILAAVAFFVYQRRAE